MEHRTAYSGLLRVYRVPWDGRTEDKTDDSVWAVTCVLVRAGFRRRGIGYALARAAGASLAIPAITEHGERAVLKICFPHRESEHEAEALHAWGGSGAIPLTET